MKALWAVEPFHQDSKQLSGLFRTLAQITGSKEKIEAGFVVTRTEEHLYLALDVPPEKRFTSYPKEELMRALAAARVPLPKARVHLVDFPTYSTTKSVDRFFELANARKAELAALFTHAREGFSRLLVGSFAETAIHRSMIPLLLANPKTEFSPTIKRIVFASDFTESSKDHFQTVVSLCKQMNAKLHVFHAARLHYSAAMDEETAAVKKYRADVDRHIAWLKESASRQQITCEVHIKSDFEMTSTAALKLAKKLKADLIVVAAKSGPGAALMGGSITRQIIRASPKPVLVLKGPK